MLMTAYLIRTYAADCNAELIESYGMIALQTPEQMTLEMCPTVSVSCCQKHTQLSMYANWIHNNEKKKVDVRYKNLGVVYNNLLLTLAKINHIAEDVKKAMILKKVANCKILADRVTNFEIEKISRKIVENLDKYEEFFIESYGGFYCSICDNENQPFFDVKRKEVHFSEKFCRDIVENTLPTLLFFHVSVVKYFNLVSKFITSCNSRGDYKTDAEVKKEYLFATSPKIKHELTECRNYRNHKSWFVYCKDICTNFKIAEFNDFFEPHIDQIEDYTHFLEHEIEEFKSEALLAPMSSGGAHPAKAQGKSAHLKKKKVRLLEEHHDNKDAIFFSGLNSKIKLDSYDSRFEENGISLFDEGRNSLINSEMYNQIKTMIFLSNPNAQSISDAEKKMMDTIAQAATGGQAGSTPSSMTTSNVQTANQATLKDTGSNGYTGYYKSTIGARILGAIFSIALALLI